MKGAMKGQTKGKIPFPQFHGGKALQKGLDPLFAPSEDDMAS